MKSRLYKKGYRLYTGHTITEKEAEMLNNAEMLCALESYSERALNYRHHVFQCIALGLLKNTTEVEQ